ncbi:Response regulator receiver domain protein [Caballeronia catudaia]|uniref:Response regulator receiver domain protein n=1 Tax=Caballeronia catudaia TaxID=1777136 RepID=A0A158DE98_9BURK|nr:response regulator [Caballeronia catudaia]SAK92952.1 Response regulator receiver domain protein [Caballeronia catudaia]
MLTYVIEDSPAKAAAILQFLAGHYPDASAELFASFQSGLKQVESSTPQLIILDMTLPTFDRVPNGREGRARPLGGYDLLRKLRRRSLNCKVIVVTQLETFGEGEDKITFAEITSICQREFPGLFVGSVYFDQGSVNWQEQLASLIDNVRSGAC